MIALIDDGDADRGPGEFLRGGESAEPRSNDDDMMQAWHQKEQASPASRPAALARLLRSAKTIPQMTDIPA